MTNHMEACILHGEVDRHDSRNSDFDFREDPHPPNLIIAYNGQTSYINFTTKMTLLNKTFITPSSSFLALKTTLA